MTEEQRQRQFRSLSIGEVVRRAVREERILFAFQPVVTADSGEVDYYECLLRMRTSDGRIIAAGDFVPVLERLGLIRLIDRYVLKKAMSELVAHPGVRLGFNISGLTATDRPWSRALTSQLRNRPEIAGRAVIEITETAAFSDIEEAARFISALRETGCRVALDDFGAGHTSLRHLQMLAVDTIKIDGSFVRNLGASPDNQVFLRHLLGLAKGFGFYTVGEGVESPSEAAILQHEGIGYMQGYYYGRPTLDRPWLQPCAGTSGRKATTSSATPPRLPGLV